MRPHLSTTSKKRDIRGNAGVSILQALSLLLRRVIRGRIGTFRVLVFTRLLSWPVRAVSRPIIRRLPRDPQLIAFGGGAGRFADNAAYLFLHMAETSDLRCVWVSPSKETGARVRSMGLEAVHRWSPDGVRVALLASWYVFSSYRSEINLWLSDGAIALNLCHGVGGKRIQRDRFVGAGSSVYRAPKGSLMAGLFADDRRPPEWQLTTSPLTTDILSRAFNVPVEQCISLGYHRNDHLVEGRRPPQALVDSALYDRIARCKTVVGYFPTFRDDSVSLPGGAPVISEMSKIIRAQGGVLVFKAHDATSITGIAGESTIVLPKEADLNAYLGICDVIVTDYSSVATDCLVLNRPVVLFWPDYRAYQHVRGFAVDPAEVLPGLVTYTKAELYEVLSRLEDIPVSAVTTRLTDLWWGATASPGAGARLAILSKIRAPTPSACPAHRRMRSPQSATAGHRGIVDLALCHPLPRPARHLSCRRKAAPPAQARFGSIPYRQASTAPRSPRRTQTQLPQ